MSSSAKSPISTIPATSSEIAKINAMTLFERAGEDPRYKNHTGFVKEMSDTCERAGANYGLARTLVINAAANDIIEGNLDQSLYVAIPPQYTQVQRDLIALKAADYLKEKFEAIIPEAIEKQASRSGGMGR